MEDRRNQSKNTSPESKRAQAVEEMTPHRTGQVLKHGGRRTLHLAATWTR